MSLRTAFFAWVALVVMAASPVKAQRGPATPEERARVVAIAQVSDKDPRAVMASADGQWFVVWRDEVPDYEFRTDKGAYWSIRAVKGDLRKAREFHHMVSVAAYQVQHQIQDPGRRAEDDAAVTLAGVEGLLRAYESLLPKRPENRSPKMDAALESRNKGELAAFVKSLEPLPRN